MINLAKFTEEKQVIMPIVDGWGVYEGRKVHTNTCDDGWYRVNLGNHAEVLSVASPLERHKALVGRKKQNRKGFALGEDATAASFDLFARESLGESVRVHFLERPIFTVINFIKWEDGRYYYSGDNLQYQRESMQTLRDAFAQRRVLSKLRGITPEQRYYFLLCHLQRESYDAVRELGKWTITDDEYRKRLKQFQSSFRIRLEHAIVQAGGTYIGHQPTGDGFLVEWEVAGDRLKSIIKDDLRIVSAGFCLSGDDRKHTMNSIVNLARLFQDEEYLNITTR